MERGDDRRGEKENELRDKVSVDLNLLVRWSILVCFANFN